MSHPHLILSHPSLFTSLELDSFEREILGNPAATEHDCSEFFTRFPKFLFLGKGRRVEREVTLLSTATGEEFRVDFFRQNYGTAFWDLIELKSPQKLSVVNAASAHSILGADVQRAVGQAADYRDLIDRDTDLRARLDRKGIRVYRPSIVVVAGRENTSVTPERLRELYDRIQQGPVEFKTYDDLHRFAKEHYESRGVVVLPSDIIIPPRDIVLREGFLRGGVISEAYGNMLEEALALAMHGVGHGSSAIFRLSSWRGATEVTVDLPLPKSTTLSSLGREEAIEWGASALSIGIIRQELGFEVVERSRGGQGFDYWLAPKELQSDILALFKGSLWALEVSGLVSSRESATQARLRDKIQQLRAAGLKQGLISIVNFGTRQIELDRVDSPSGREDA